MYRPDPGVSDSCPTGRWLNGREGRDRVRIEASPFSRTCAVLTPIPRSTPTLPLSIEWSVELSVLLAMAVVSGVVVAGGDISGVVGCG